MKLKKIIEQGFFEKLLPLQPADQDRRVIICILTYTVTLTPAIKMETAKRPRDVLCDVTLMMARSTSYTVCDEEYSKIHLPVGCSAMNSNCC